MDSIFSVLIVAGVMVAMDYVWLGMVAKKFVHREIGTLLLNRPNFKAATLFYAIYAIGVTLLVVSPALASDAVGHAVMYGALFGLVAYATYDLTNLATLKGFSVKLVVVDLAWGSFVTMVAATIAFLVASIWLV